MITVIMAILVAVFIGYRHVLDMQDQFISVFQKDVDMTIDKVHHMATKDGRKEWSLDARSAHYISHKKEVRLKELRLVFFMLDGGKIHLTADRGILKSDTKDMQVEGNVLVRNKDYRLKTENLDYNHDKRLIVSKVPVLITGDTLHLTADSMSFNLNTKKTILNGKVKGTLHEKVSL